MPKDTQTKIATNRKARHSSSSSSRHHHKSSTRNSSRDTDPQHDSRVRYTRSPEPTKEPYPRAWCPPKLRIDVASLPSLPPLPSTHAKQVFLHKSAVGNDPSKSQEAEALCYKPLEFFGDSIIEAHVRRILLEEFPGRGPGLLTWVREQMVNNQTLGVLGWGCGLAPLIKLGKDSELAGEGGRNCTQHIVAEVLEAYIGALALDPSSNDALRHWFTQVFSKHGPVFPRLQEEVSQHLELIKPSREKKLAAKEAFKLSRAGQEILSNKPRLVCKCTTGTHRATLYRLVEQHSSFKTDTGGRLWHVTLSDENGEELGCGSAERRLDAREEAWASALIAAKKLA